MEIAPTKIICLIRSYAAHAEEMSGRIPERPLFFLKPPSSLLANQGEILIPHGVEELHHEVELALVIGKGGRFIPEEEAEDHIGCMLPMLDITARDLQSRAKSEGLPWSEAKGYDTFAPLGPEAVPFKGSTWRGRRIWLSVNGRMRQESNTDCLIFPPGRIVSEISKRMTLEKGDIIMTGTPSGVGPLEYGDTIEAGIEGMEPMSFKVRRIPALGR